MPAVPMWAVVQHSSSRRATLVSRAVPHSTTRIFSRAPLAAGRRGGGTGADVSGASLRAAAATAVVILVDDRSGTYSLFFGWKRPHLSGATLPRSGAAARGGAAASDTAAAAAAAAIPVVVLSAAIVVSATVVVVSATAAVVSAVVVVSATAAVVSATAAVVSTQSSSERPSYQQQSSSERPSYQQEEQRLWQQERETERQQEERARPASSYRSDYRREDEDHGGYRQQRPFDHLRGGYRDHEDRGYPDDEERRRRADKERERYFDDTRHHASSSESERYESERFSDDPSPAYGAGSPYGHRPPGQDLDRYGYSRATSEGQRKRELPPWQQRESAPARQASPPPQRAPPPTSSQRIAEGEAVELTGIMSKPHLNGAIAIVLGRQGDRWKVELNDGSQLALKETNLALLSSDPSDEPFEPPPAQPQQMQQQPRQQQARRDPWASDEDDDGAGVMASSRQPLRTQSPPPALPPKKAPMSLEIPAFNPKKEPMPPKPPEPLKAKPPPPPPPPKPPEPKKEEISYDIDNQDDDDDFDPTEFMDFDM